MSSPQRLLDPTNESDADGTPRHYALHTTSSLCCKCACYCTGCQPGYEVWAAGARWRPIVFQNVLETRVPRVTVAALSARGRGVTRGSWLVAASTDCVKGRQGQPFQSRQAYFPRGLIQSRVNSELCFEFYFAYLLPIGQHLVSEVGSSGRFSQSVRRGPRESSVRCCVVLAREV